MKLPAAVLLAALAGTPALAHITLAEPEAAAGAYYAGFFRVSHGCDGSPTVALTITLPEGVDVARPQPKPGWTLEIERAPLAAPRPSEGGALTERVASVTWRGELPEDEFDQFGIMMKLPESAGPIYFPAVQTCAAGKREWTDIPAEGQAWGDVPSPAPVLTLAAPAGTEHHH